MAIKQLSVFVENKEGTLAVVTDAIAQCDIDIRAMSVADTQEFGIVRLIVNDFKTAKEKLNDKNLFVSATDVVGVAVDDKPGGMAKVVRLLADNNINLDYMYAFVTVAKAHACVVLRVDDNEAAEKVLTDNGVKLITQEEIEAL